MGEQELQKPVELSSGSDMLSEVVANPKLSRGELLGVKRDIASLGSCEPEGVGKKRKSKRKNFNKVFRGGSGGSAAGASAGDDGEGNEGVAAKLVQSSFKPGDVYAGMSLVERLGAGEFGETWKASWKGESGLEIFYALKIPRQATGNFLRDL